MVSYRIASTHKQTYAQKKEQRRCSLAAIESKRNARLYKSQRYAVKVQGYQTAQPTRGGC